MVFTYLLTYLLNASLLNLIYLHLHDTLSNYDDDDDDDDDCIGNHIGGVVIA
jgi:hypothetical protein